VRRAIHISIMIALSVGILAAIVFAVGFERTAAAVADAGPLAFAVVGGLTLAFLLIQAAAWAILNRPIKHRVPFLRLLKGSVVGVAGNILTPSTYLGGEPLKIVYVGRAAHLPYHEVAGTVLLSKYIESVSFILLLSFSAVVATLSYRESLFGPYLGAGVAIVIFTTALLTLCGAMWLSLSRRWRPLTRVLRALARLPVLRQRLPGVLRRTRDMEDQVSRVFCEEKAAASQTFGIHVLGHITIFLKPALFFYLGAGMGLSLGQLCLLFVVSQALLAVQLTPSGAGVLDTGFIGAFALMGLNDDQHLAKCMAFLLCLRFWDIIIVGVGAWLASREGARVLFVKPARIVTPELTGDELPDKSDDRPASLRDSSGKQSRSG